MIRLTLGHDLCLTVVPKGPAGGPADGYLLLATTTDPDKVLGTMGETGIEGPSDGMLTVAADQAMRMFPGHARVAPPEADQYRQPHAFVRDRNHPGFVCRCGEEANTAIHGRA